MTPASPQSPARTGRVLLVLGGLLAVALIVAGLAVAWPAPPDPPPPTPVPVAVVPPTAVPPTAVPPTAVPPTDTPVPPTDTPVPPTGTAVPPTATAVSPTDTAVVAAKTALPPPPTPRPRRSPTAVAYVPAPAPPRKPAPPPVAHGMTAYAPGGQDWGKPRPNNPKRIVRITSSDVQLNAEVIEVYLTGGVWPVADYAAGHHAGSANPGEGGNIVITGHNNWRGEVFRYLEFMSPGNTITLWTQEGRSYQYVVTNIDKLLEKGVDHATQMEHSAVMDATPYEQLTLITCWPYKTYDHRLIITARPTS